MNRRVALSAGALFAAAFLGSSAGAQQTSAPSAGDMQITMSGVYKTTDDVVTMTFGADGQMDGQSPTGVRVRDTFVIEDNVFTLTAAPDHPMCPSAVGVYTLTEENGVITMTRVSDECEVRGNNLDGGQWVRVGDAPVTD